MRKYSSALSFTDLLFNLLLSFVCLFVLSFILINPNQEDGKVDPKAEFIITLTWEEESHDDIDLWVEDPEGNVVFYSKREAGLMHLDRDDQGTTHDRIVTEGQEIVLEHNQEIVTIRGTVRGEYVVNAHAYSKHSDEITKANVQVLKLNPYSIVCNKNAEFVRDGQEETICRFNVDSAGAIESTSDLPKNIAMR